MEKMTGQNHWVAKAAAGAVALGFAGLLVMTVKDVFFPRQPEKELRKAQGMVRSLFDKNKALEQEVQRLTEQRLKAMKDLELKNATLVNLKSEALAGGSSAQILNSPLSSPGGGVKEVSAPKRKKIEPFKTRYMPREENVNPKQDLSAQPPAASGWRSFFENTASVKKGKNESLKTNGVLTEESRSPELRRKKIEPFKTRYMPREENVNPKEGLSAQPPAASGWRTFFESAANGKMGLQMAGGVTSGAEIVKQIAPSPQTEDAEKLQVREYQKQIEALENRISDLQADSLRQQARLAQALKVKTAAAVLEQKYKTGSPRVSAKATKAENSLRSEEKTGNAPSAADRGKAQAEKKPEPAKSESEAIQDLETQRRLDQGTYYYNLGVLYSRTAMYQEAADMYEKALDVNPEDASSHYNLGIIYEEYLNKVQLAIPHYRAFLLYSPDPEKKKIVADWIQLANFNNPKEGNLRFESGKKAFEALLFTKPD